MLDWEITTKQLISRMTKWKDVTLVRRLQALGYTHYKPKTMGRLIAGKYKIPVKTRTKLERRYLRMVKEYAQNLKEPIGIGGAPILTGTWYTITHWMENRQKEHPELNVDYSLIKMGNRNLNFVWTRGDLVIFTDRRISEEPTKAQPNMGLYVVYEVGIYTNGSKTYVETFIQASETAVYFSDPTSEQAQREMKAQADVYEERNKRVISTGRDMQFMYNWNKGEQEGEIKYVGIGVRI